MSTKIDAVRRKSVRSRRGFSACICTAAKAKEFLMLCQRSCPCAWQDRFGCRKATRALFIISFNTTMRQKWDMPWTVGQDVGQSVGCGEWSQASERTLKIGVRRKLKGSAGGLQHAPLGCVPTFLAISCAPPCIMGVSPHHCPCTLRGPPPPPAPGTRMRHGATASNRHGTACGTSKEGSHGGPKRAPSVRANPPRALCTLTPVRFVYTGCPWARGSP